MIFFVYENMKSYKI